MNNKMNTDTHTSSMLLVVLSCFIYACDAGKVEMAPIAELEEASFNYQMLPLDKVRVASPRHITVAPDGRWIVLDTIGRILIYQSDGELIRSWFMPETEDGRPEGVCLLRDGRIAVADTHYQRVLFFNFEGELLDQFGRRSPLVAGEMPTNDNKGDFIYPVSIVQDHHGHLLVAEYGGQDRIQRFTVSGKWLGQFGAPGSADGEFQRPSGMVLSPFIIQPGEAPRKAEDVSQRTLVIVDAQNQRIQGFDLSGAWRWTIPQKQTELTQHQKRIFSKPLFNFPYDADIDQEGNLWVIDWGGAKLTKLNPETGTVRQYGSPGTNRHQLRTPWSMALTEHGVLIADTGNRRLIRLNRRSGN